MKYPVRSAYLSSARNDALEEVELSEEAFGVMKTLRRPKRTNLSVGIDRMDDYQAIYHKTSDASSRYPSSMSKAEVEVDFKGGRI